MKLFKKYTPSDDLKNLAEALDAASPEDWRDVEGVLFGPSNQPGPSRLRRLSGRRGNVLIDTHDGELSSFEEICGVAMEGGKDGE